MMGKSHVAFSAMLTATTLPVANQALGLGFGPEELLVGVGVGAVAGVLPDIDHPDSFITHGVIPGSGIFGKVGKGLGYLLCIPPRIIGVGARATMNHRGGTHSLLFAVGWALLAAPLYAAIFTGIASLFVMAFSSLLASVGFGMTPGEMFHWVFERLPAVFPLVMISVFIGYVGHLIADSMTNVPVPWPWPFSKKRWSLLPKGLRITTDSFTENRLLRPMFLVVLILALIWNIGMPIGSSLMEKVSGEPEQEKGQEKKPRKQNKQKR